MTHSAFTRSCPEVNARGSRYGNWSQPTEQPVEQAERFIHTLVLRGLSPRTRRDLRLRSAGGLPLDGRSRPAAGADSPAMTWWRSSTTCSVRHRPRPRPSTGGCVCCSASSSSSPAPRRWSTAWRQHTHALQLPLPLPARIGAHQGAPPGDPSAQGRPGAEVLQQPQDLARPLHDAADVGRGAAGGRGAQPHRQRHRPPGPEPAHSGQGQQAARHAAGRGGRQHPAPLRASWSGPPQTSQAVFVVLKGPRRGQPLSAEGLRRIFRYHRSKSGIARRPTPTGFVTASAPT